MNGRYRIGVAHALFAAALFGCGAPLSKLLLDRGGPGGGTLDPLILAALLYIGSGLGLLAGKGLVRLVQKTPDVPVATDEPLRGQAWFWFLFGTACSGLLAPPLLMWGLAHSAASESSLLLSLESAFTAVLAWGLFRENWNGRVILGILFVVAGAAALSFQPGTGGFHLSWGALAVAASTLGWGIDNNCTRKIARCGAVRLAVLKGLGSGLLLLAFALTLGKSLPSPAVIALALLLGTFSIGLCLAQMILSMRALGAARMAAWFSPAPFFGALLSFPLLHDPLTARFLLAAGITAFGLWLHATEGPQPPVDKAG